MMKSENRMFVFEPFKFKRPYIDLLWIRCTASCATNRKLYSKLYDKSKQWRLDFRRGMSVTHIRTD